MRRPWEKVLFHGQSFCPGMIAKTLEKPFCSRFSRLFPECSHNLAVCRGQWFRHAVLPDRGAVIPISSRLVLSTPRLPTSFTLPNICKRARSATHFVHNSLYLHSVTC